MKLSTGIFKASSPIRATSKGSAGYDNARENIDPHIKTKVLSSREGSIEKVPVDGHDIVNKTYCDSHYHVPSGAIIMWHGLIANIPSGWVLCNGANGTPDLRDKFVKGASAGSEAGGTGGASTHTHTFTGSALATHTHTFTGSALATHDHTFSGSALAAHKHSGITSTSVLAGTTDSAVSGALLSLSLTGIRQGSGATINVVTSGVITEAGHIHNLTSFISNMNTWIGLCETASTSAGTPAGTISAKSAGTPAGSNSSTSGGTPAGTNSTESNVPPYYAILFIMKT